MNHEYENQYTGLEVAVIGMAGRFPQAENVEEFWNKLVDGCECITFFSDRELRESGVKDEYINNPAFIKAYGWLDGIDMFDASFFGYSPLEAELMDPQMCIFHESVWEALEDAGCDPNSYKKLIGLYAGASANFYWQARVEMAGKNLVLGTFTSKQFNDKDFLCTRIAHRLNLNGPAVLVDTACSTSLVAVHMACQGLLSGDCDMALAGGVSVGLLDKSGYLFQEGMLSSPDGHCRAFDARARGTNFGNAAGVVVLKRLDDAVADGDTVHAVIRGSSINNDGGRKAAYTAPSIEGQAFVIRTAQKMAEVGPDTIGYVETHGTGTTLGDPVEIEGLKAAFNTDKKHFCRIGSVKTNVGHLESAAGIAGFIKTVMALKHRLIPPSLFFEKPNPGIDLENSPFVVNKKLTHWEPANGLPLRAGVSSFGIGGTNAHVVLEEWTENGGRGTDDRRRKYHLIVLSAKTGTALDKMTENLGGYLKENPGTDIADAAYTMQVGRKVHRYRRVLVCADTGEAAALLSNPASGKILSHSSREDDPFVVFMFPGQGAQYIDMGRDLYEEEPLFRDRMDRCFKLLEPLMEENLKESLYPSPGDNRSYKTDKSYSEKLNRPEIAPVAIFIFEYALTELLLSWGIKPHAMIGYSFGEYTAACVSGVFTLEDALKLVVFRGKLIRKMTAGAMLSVPLSKKDLTPLLPSNPDISPAIDNGPSCVVSGTVDAVRAFEEQMKKKKLMCLPVPVPHALHSPAMATVSREFEAFLSTLTLNKPGIPYISNVTGDWITGEETVDPAYWSGHLRRTVRFADGMRELLKEPGSLFVEVGPGRDISTLTLRHIETHGNDDHQVLNMVRHSHKNISDAYHLYKRIGKLWLYGHPIDWEGFYSGEKGRRTRVSLPTYPFERRRFRIEADYSKLGNAAQLDIPLPKPDMADWFYIPSWKRSTPLSDRPPEIAGGSNWLIFSHEGGLAEQLEAQLDNAGRHVTVVTAGTEFEKINDRAYTLNPREDYQYERLLEELCTGEGNRVPHNILHLWGIPGGSDRRLEIHSIDKILNAGYYSLLNIARAIGERDLTDEIQIVVVSHEMQQVTGRDDVCPAKAAILGPVSTIPTEYANLNCLSIDIPLPGPGTPEEGNMAKWLLKEFAAEAPGPAVAYRDGYRWVRAFEPVRLEHFDKDKKTPPLKEEGVYLITGGLGGIGFALARRIAKHAGAKLVLTGRTPLPPGDKKIQKIIELEELGARVLVFTADVEDPARMKEVIEETKETFGRIDGVIHSAGVADGAMIQRRTRKESEKVFASKIRGTVVLDSLLKDIPLDFVVYCSSIASVIPQFGQAAYCAGNCFLDALADRRFFRDGTYTVSINWDRWRNVGIAVALEEQHRQLAGDELTGGISLEEGVETFMRIMAASLPRVAVSPEDLENRIKRQRLADLSSFLESVSGASDLRAPQTLFERPKLETEYVAPRDDTERATARIWQLLFGFKQVGIRDDFIELGGDSLKAITMINRVKNEFKVSVPLPDFFKEPTIRWLAGYIAGAEKDTRGSIPPAEEREYYPVSFIQKRIFVLMEVDHESTAYNNAFPLIVEGNLDRERLEGALNRLIRRHQSLRTSFDLIHDEPVQIVHDAVEFNVQYIGPAAGTGGRETLDGGFLEPLIRDFVKPYDLKKPPLMRIALVKLEREKHLMLIDMHHIVTDGTSFSILTRDFVDLYDGMELPPLPLQYKDFSQWQYSGKGRVEIEKQEKYWLRRFEDGVPVLNLRTDFPRPPVQSFEGEYIIFLLEGVLKKSLLRLVKDTETTLYVMLSAICSVLLYKYTGEEDIVIGSPVAARDRVELENLVGLFINALVLRNYPRGRKSFSEFLKEVKENSLTAFENQGYPFGRLIEQVDMKKDLSRNPLYDFELIVQNMETSELKTEDLRFIPYSFDPKTAQTDIALEVEDMGEG
ncbi:MAG: SDR family NAD(P)-dependent oxidoreductase, partial [bacterium]|nr:SDR family NAD(P)-dependent oxidoreductase [bacterium]